jgi:hypothetical protein
MRKLLLIWKWSLAATARSPVELLALTAVAALWIWGAYQWLWVPESSIWVLLLALVWALIQIQVLVGILAGVAIGSTEAAQAGALHLRLRALFKFDRRQFVQCFVMLVAAAVIVVLAAWLFNWVNAHALEVASFLTFRSEHPVSPHTIENIWGWIALVLWSGLGGLLWYYLLNVLSTGWGKAWHQLGHAVLSCCLGACLLTSLVTVLVFGGLANLLVGWHPKVGPGFWDYAQVILRFGASLILLVAGWLFWSLALARMIVVSREEKPVVAGERHVDNSSPDGA